jgi:hypothetical protein
MGVGQGEKKQKMNGRGPGSDESSHVVDVIEFDTVRMYFNGCVYILFSGIMGVLCACGYQGATSAVIYKSDCG